MSTSQITSQTNSQSHRSDVQHCRRCGMVLAPVATFCRKCGERVEKPAPYTKDLSSIDRHIDLERYRITSLIQRIPYTQLSLAIDREQQRPVVIRDIDIQQIDIANRSPIFRALQQEYDLLRRQYSNDILPLIASFYAHNHLYSISAWPLTVLSQKSVYYGHVPHIYTLQDLLQSGIGLPDEQLALDWILRLAKAVEHLHRNNIVIGTLDPSTILLSQKDYSGQPKLFPSWVLPAVRSQLQQVLNTANASHIAYITAKRAAFFAPEAKQGQPEICSDVYSMAAILYLLVTGIAPAEQSITASQQLRSPHKINPRVQSTLATTILKALSREPAARFQSVNEFVAALQQQGASEAFQRLYNVLFGHNRSVGKARPYPAEINVTSDKDNNKTEQGNAAQADLETIDDTIRIAPKQLAIYYLSHINTQKLGQLRLNSDYEESMLRDVYLEKIKQIEGKDTEQILSENPATVVEVVSGPAGGTSLPNKSDNTASSSLDEQNTDTQSSKTDTEEAPETQTTVTDADANLNESPAVSVESDADANPDESAAVSLESDADANLNESAAISFDVNEQIPLTGPSQQNASATDVPTDSENTSSSANNDSQLPLPSEVLQQDKRDHATRTKPFSALLERVKRFVLGDQPHINNAVAMIETPMRIQPNTNYTIRIHIMGRNEPKRVSGFKQSNNTAELGGLGSLVHGELVHIEVRSALYHSYAYIVQQTDVEVPAHNYAAEVTIPMRSITDRSGTKRERLHIFFTNEKRNPLYEQPFLIELFISNLVQSGHEGYNVLSIPL
jgi:serine/threonine protein kinase/ribosomal protein L40E